MKGNFFGLFQTDALVSRPQLASLGAEYQWIAYLDTRGTNSPASPNGSSYFKRVCKSRPDGSGVVILTK